MVLTTPQVGPASRLQSLIASGEAAKLKLEPLPTGGLEAKFDTGDWFGWATVAWAKLKNPSPHPMIRSKKAEAQPFRIADGSRSSAIGGPASMALRKLRYRSARTPIHWQWSCTSEMSVTPSAAKYHERFTA